jgi:hypothetical protein
MYLRPRKRPRTHAPAQAQSRPALYQINPFADFEEILITENVPSDGLLSYSLGTLEGQVHLADLPSKVLNNMNGYASRWRSEATKRKWRSDWRTSVDYCFDWNVTPLPMQPLVAACICSEEAAKNYSMSHIRGLGSSIGAAHRLAGFDDPTKSPIFRRVFAGIRRTHPNAKGLQKIALMRADVRAMTLSAPTSFSLRQHQEVCSMKFLYASAVRRGEAASARKSHLERTRDGYLLHIPRSKTDQEAKGATIQLRPDPDCAVDVVAALDAWLEILGPGDGPLFRHISMDDQLSADAINDRTLARTVQRAAQRIGLLPGDVGAHSLRAGWATDALLNGISEAAVAAHLRHANLDHLLRYYRPRANRVNLTKALTR